MEIRPINIGQIRQQTLQQQPAAGSSAASSFSSVMEQALQPAAEAEAAAKTEQVSLLTGDSASIHSVVMATEQADIALRLTMQIRTKVLDAYNEVMRMQI